MFVQLPNIVDKHSHSTPVTQSIATNSTCNNLFDYEKIVKEVVFFVCDHVAKQLEVNLHITDDSFTFTNEELDSLLFDLD